MRENFMSGLGRGHRKRAAASGFAPGPYSTMKSLLRRFKKWRDKQRAKAISVYLNNPGVTGWEGSLYDRSGGG